MTYSMRQVHRWLSIASRAALYRTAERRWAATTASPSDWT